MKKHKKGKHYFGVRATLLMAIILFIPLNYALAKIYKYTDKDGRVHYSQTPPNTLNSTEMNIKISPPSNSDLTTSHSITTVDNLKGSEKPASCDNNVDSFIRNEQIYCCNERCINEQTEKGVDFDCLPGPCRKAMKRIWMDKQNKAQAARVERNKKNSRDDWRKKRDQNIIDKCNKKKYTYCDKSPEEILNKMEDARARSGRRQGVPIYRQTY